MKLSSKGFFLQSAIWIVLSLLWTFLTKNLVMGIVSLCASAIFLIKGLLVRNQERKGGEPDKKDSHHE